MKNITKNGTNKSDKNNKYNIPSKVAKKMSIPRYTAFHFSQANPQGAGQENVSALLRRVADTIDELGDVDISDLILHPALTSDGENRPSITVYYHDRTDIEE